MRLHARPGHPDYRADCGAFDVLLDGTPLDKGCCIFADEENAFVEIVIRDMSGYPLTDNTNTIITETKRGRVQIVDRTAALLDKRRARA